MLRESAEGTILEANPALVELLGYESASHLQGLPAQTIFADAEQASGCRLRLLDGGRAERQDARLVRQDGEKVWVQHDAILVPSARGGAAQILRTFVDIQERREREIDLQEMAYHDQLTGVPNRRLLQLRAEQTLALAARRKTRSALFFLDLVDFKVVNDRLGHGAGDELLRRVAQRVAGELRSADTLARMGGDEFAVLLSEVESREAAVQTAERFLRRLAEPIDLAGESVVVQARAGVAIYPEDGEDLSSLLGCADRALIRAKAGVVAIISDGAAPDVTP
jgi:diguanylate cyclase (GGDEF)-like protein/PAS domain S-box-containing protein